MCASRGDRRRPRAAPLAQFRAIPKSCPLSPTNERLPAVIFVATEVDSTARERQLHRRMRLQVHDGENVNRNRSSRAHRSRGLSFGVHHTMSPQGSRCNRPSRPRLGLKQRGEVASVLSKLASRKAMRDVKRCGAIVRRSQCLPGTCDALLERLPRYRQCLPPYPAKDQLPVRLRRGLVQIPCHSRA